MSEIISADSARGCKRPLERNQDYTVSSFAGRVSNATPFPQFPPPPKQPSNAPGEGLGDHEKDPYQEDDDLINPADLPNDTMATLMYLQREFYAGRAHAKRNGPRTPAGSGAQGDRAVGGGERTGVVLQHQIYTVLANRTAVDMELTAMRNDNILRTFRLSTGREDWGVLSTEHYLRLIRNFFVNKMVAMQGESQIARRDGTRRGEGRGDSDISGRLRPPPGEVLERLVRTIARAYASRKELSNVMEEVMLERAGERGEEGPPSGSEGEGNNGVRNIGGRGVRGNGKRSRVEKEGLARKDQREEEEQGLASLKRNKDRVLAVASELIRAGFLLPRRDVGREEAYWFSIPQLGKVTASIARGRKEIMGALKRTRYKEMRRSALEAKNPARGTGLPVGFHIRDLVGLGVVRQLDTPSGAFIRLVQGT